MGVGGRGRGPIYAVILAATGQDVRVCSGCGNCDRGTAPGMDLTIGEVMRAAARDDPAALTNQTIWASDDVLAPHPLCQAGLDIPTVILTLCREAKERGHGPV